MTSTAPSTANWNVAGVWAKARIQRRRVATLGHHCVSHLNRELRRRRAPARLRRAISVGGSFGPARTVARRGRRQTREAGLRIGGVAAIRAGLARTRHHEVADLASACRNTAREILSGTSVFIPDLAAQIPRVARKPCGSLHAGTAFGVDAFTAVSLLACRERARLAFLVALALLVAQHFRPAAHRPGRAGFHVAGVTLLSQLFELGCRATRLHGFRRSALRRRTLGFGRFDDDLGVGAATLVGEHARAVLAGAFINLRLAAGTDQQPGG